METKPIIDATWDLREPGLRFEVVDAVDMQGIRPNSAAIVLDKGCLDCFVSGGGEASIGAYLEQVARVLQP